MISPSDPTDDGIVVLTLERPEKRRPPSIAPRNAMSEASGRMADGIGLGEFEEQTIADGMRLVVRSDA